MKGQRIFSMLSFLLIFIEHVISRSMNVLRHYQVHQPHFMWNILWLWWNINFYSLFYGYFLTRTIDGHFWVSKYFFNCWVFYVWDHCEISWGWCSWLRLRWRSPAQPPSYWHQELIESNQEQPTPGKLKQKIIYQCTCAELSHFKGKSRSSFHIQLVGE